MCYEWYAEKGVRILEQLEDPQALLVAKQLLKQDKGLKFRAKRVLWKAGLISNGGKVDNSAKQDDKQDVQETDIIALMRSLGYEGTDEDLLAEKKKEDLWREEQDTSRGGAVKSDEVVSVSDLIVLRAGGFDSLLFEVDSRKLLDLIQNANPDARRTQLLLVYEMIVEGDEGVRELHASMCLDLLASARSRSEEYLQLCSLRRGDRYRECSSANPKF